MPSTDRNKPLRKDHLRLIVAGITKHYPSGSMTLAGQTFTPSELTKRLHDDIDLIDVADKARADWLTKVQVQRNSNRQLVPVLRALKSQILAQFGDTQDASSTLADFGYSPRKVTTTTSATKAGAAAKVRATRVARHTMGKNEKKTVKGTASAVSAPPAVSPPSAAVPAPPVPAAGTPKST